MCTTGEVQREMVTFRGKSSEYITHWLIFLVTVIYSGQILSHLKDGSYNVASYSC